LPPQEIGLIRCPGIFEPGDRSLEGHQVNPELVQRGRLSLVADDPEAFAAARAVYAAIDAAVGELLAAAGDVEHVLVVSGDGGGPNHAGWHLLPEVLERMGFLVPPGKAGGDDGPTAKPGLYGRLRGLVPSGLRQSVSRRLPASLRDRLMKKGADAHVDWSRTRAFCLPTDLEGCVRINLRGREPEGIVAPGEHLFSLEVWSRRNGSAPRAHKLPLSGFLEKAASLGRRENCATRSVAPI